jgi:hypothetical protein
MVDCQDPLYDHLGDGGLQGGNILLHSVLPDKALGQQCLSDCLLSKLQDQGGGSIELAAVPDLGTIPDPDASFVRPCTPVVKRHLTSLHRKSGS